MCIMHLKENLPVLQDYALVLISLTNIQQMSSKHALSTKHESMSSMFSVHMTLFSGVKMKIIKTVR